MRQSRDCDSRRQRAAVNAIGAERRQKGHPHFQLPVRAFDMILILLCHKLARWQQGQRSKRLAMLRASLIRMVAIEALMWRSARIGGSAGSITRG